MIEALRSIHFAGDVGLGDGVVVFETQRLFGGDSGWFYTGTYEVQGRKVTGRASIQHYGVARPTVTGHVPGQKLKIEFVAELKPDGKEMTASATVVGAPDQTLVFSMKRLADLP